MPTLINFTVGEFLRHVRDVCAEHPDTVNPTHAEGSKHIGCAYQANTTHGTCMCLVGHVLVHKLGLTWVYEWEGETASSVLRFEGILPDYYHENGALLMLANMVDVVQQLADESEDLDRIDVFGAGYGRRTWSEVWRDFVSGYPSWEEF